MKRSISIFNILYSVAIYLVVISPSEAHAQDFKIDTNDIEAPTKGLSAKKSKESGKAADPVKTVGEHNAGSPDRQFGELEGWSPGKEPPKDPKDTSPTPAGGPSGRGTRVTSTPNGGVGVGLGF